MADKKDYYKNEFGFIGSNQVVETPRGRVIFLNLKTPSRKSKKYGFALMFPKDSSLDKNTIPKLRVLQAIGKDLIKEAGDKAKGLKYKSILDGDELDDERFHGNFYIKCSDKNVPELVDINKDRLNPEDFANGMICKASVSPGFFVTSGPGISYNAKALMLVKDDDVRFKGSYSGVSAFSDEDEEETEDELDTLSDDEDEDEEPAPKKKLKKKAKKVEVEEEEEEEEEEEIAPPKKLKKKVKKAPVVEEEDEEEEELEEEDEEDEDDLPPPPKKKAKAAIAGKKSKTAAMDLNDVL